MNTALAKEELAQILDQAVQDVTERTAGVRLRQMEQSPGEDLCTVQLLGFYCISRLKKQPTLF